MKPLFPVSKEREAQARAIIEATDNGRTLNADESVLLDNVLNGLRLTPWGEGQWAAMLQRYSVDA